ncbi:MAG: DedA family protein [Candidatus Aenigmatarchaeota archaeon]
MIDVLLNWVLSIVAAYGPWGILIGMFLESSIVPIPSEIVLVTAGLAGVPLWQIVVFGTIGSTLGSIIGYYIGRGGRRFIDRYGKYILVTEKRIKKADNWFKRYGNWTILISRLIPFVPYKVFSITAGILRMRLSVFVLFTFIGTIPRALILGYFGSLLIGLETPILIAIGIAFVIAILVYYIYKRLHKSVKK